MKYGVIRDKFEFTEEMKICKENYAEDNEVDNLKDYITENCDIVKDKRILRDNFRKQYNEWLVSNSRSKDTSTNTKFTRIMKDKYKIISKESNHKVYYLDIEWNTNDNNIEEI